MRRLLMADRTDDDGTEAEPVIVDTDGQVVTLTLDDGTVLGFARGQLVEAVQEDRRAA